MLFRSVIEQTTAVGSSMCWVELGWVHTSFGQLSRAEEIFRQTSDQGWRERGLTFTAFLKGDRPTLLKRLRPFPTAGVKSPMMVSLMIRAGMLAEAETKIRGMQVSSVLATQLLGDLAVRQPLRYEPEHLLLLRREVLGERVPLGAVS